MHAPFFYIRHPCLFELLAPFCPVTLEQLGNLGELVGAIAVVVSLLYLAVQIRHSSRVAQFEAHRNISESIASILGEIAKDLELYQMWKVMTETPAEATHDDRERFGMLLHRFFTVFSDAHRFSDTDPHLAMRYETFIRRLLVMPAVHDWWSRQNELYSDPFKSLVDEIAAQSEIDSNA